MSEYHDIDKDFYKFAMDLFVKSGHTNPCSPIFINHSSNEMIYLDNKDAIALSQSQRELLNDFQNVSFLFERGDETFSKQCSQRISFYSLDLICSESMKSQTTADIISLFYTVTQSDAIILLCRYDNSIIISFAGYEAGCILSDWYSEELDFENIIEKLHAANVGFNSAKEYFFDLAYNMAREYYIYPLHREMALYIMLPCNYFLENMDKVIYRDEMEQMIQDSLNSYKNKYGDDYVELDSYGSIPKNGIEDTLDLLLIELMNYENEDSIDDEAEIGNFMDENLRDTDQIQSGDYEFDDLDPDIFMDPTLMVKWLERHSEVMDSETSIEKDDKMKITEWTEANNVREFFERAGLKVVDKRQKGGCLWVVGDEESIGEYVNEAIDKFSISGKYCRGKAIQSQMGWYTKTEK